MPGTGDEYFNTNGSTIKKIIVGKYGNFNGSFALAGVKPWQDDLSEIIAPISGDQIKANYGNVKKTKPGQVFSGDPGNGIYGLFAARPVFRSVDRLP